MLRLSSLGAILVLLATSSFAWPQESSHQLRYRFQAGQVLDFEIIQQTTVESTAMGQSSEASVRNQSQRRWKILEVDAEGVATIEVTTLRLQMRSREGGKVIEYDSADPEKQPEEFKTLKDVIGKPLSIVRVAPDGTVLDEKMLTQTDTATKMQADQILPLLPEKPVATGYTWRRKFDIRLGQPGKGFPARKSFTLASVKDGKATIQFKTTLLAPVSNPALEAQLIQHRPSGTIEFDVQRGLVVSQKQAIDDTVVGFLGPASAFSIKSTATERLVDVSLAKATDNTKSSR